MSKGAPPPLESFFQDLHRSLIAEDYPAALSLSNQILDIDSNDLDALHSKVICLLNLDESSAEKALKLLDSNSELSSKLSFERAYGYFRTRKLQQALSFLDDNSIFPQPKSKRVLELIAQVYYKLEDYEKSAQIYEKIIKEFGTNSFEILTNLLAAYTLSESYKEIEKTLANYKNYLQSNFEFAYNAACGSIEGGDYDTAEKFLLLAQKSCKDALADSTNEEIQSELSVIFAQLGYIRQMQGKIDEALDFYNRALKANPSDESVVAVATNNIVSLGKDQDLRENAKKLKQIATSQTVDSKLSTEQKKIISFNRCLLLFLMGQEAECKDLVKIFQEQYPDSDRFPLILSALYFKEKKLDQSQTLLEQFAAQHPDSFLAKLSIIQLHLNKGNLSDAIKILESIEILQNKPAVASTLVYLHEKVGDIESAMKVLDNLVKFYESQKDQETFVKILKESANFKMRYKYYKEAATNLEKILKIVKNDTEAMASIVIAYSQFDPRQAEMYVGRLPKLVGQKENIDVEKLENFLPHLRPTRDTDKKIDKSGKSETLSKETIKKNKKKKRLPKDLTKPLDPERWIPLKQRSYYKKRGRRNKGLSSGGQGSQAIGRSVQQEKAKEAEKVQNSPTNETKPEPQQVPKPKPPTSKKKQGGKKKR